MTQGLNLVLLGAKLVISKHLFRIFVIYRKSVIRGLILGEQYIFLENRRI